MTVDPLVRMSTNVPMSLLSQRRAAERRTHLLIGFGVVCLVFLGLLILANSGSSERPLPVAVAQPAAPTAPAVAATTDACPAADLGDDYMRKRVPGYLSPREACLLQRQAQEVIDRDAQPPGLDMTGHVVRER